MSALWASRSCPTIRRRYAVRRGGFTKHCTQDIFAPIARKLQVFTRGEIEIDPWCLKLAPDAHAGDVVLFESAQITTFEDHPSDRGLSFARDRV